MAKAGWDHGPQSIWFKGVNSGEFGEQVPSVATIGRILAESGVTKANPRKRPRTAWMRFARSYPMEMWQLDGLEYRLFDPDGTKATIYQLLDDGTRFDVGSLCFERPENSEDAISALRAAFEEYGAPQELLTDNGLSFNQARRGNISSTEIFLAERGCRGITGRIWHPETQGKNERNHQTLIRFLDAHAPNNLNDLSKLMVCFREHYNYRRRHQSLKVGSTHLTPGQAWEARSETCPATRLPPIATPGRFSSNISRPRPMFLQKRSTLTRSLLRTSPDYSTIWNMSAATASRPAIPA